MRRMALLIPIVAAMLAVPAATVSGQIDAGPQPIAPAWRLRPRGWFSAVNQRAGPITAAPGRRRRHRPFGSQQSGLKAGIGYGYGFVYPTEGPTIPLSCGCPLCLLRAGRQHRGTHQPQATQIGRKR